MKIFKTSEIKEIDAYTINNEPVLSVDLMGRAAAAFAGWMMNRINREKQMIFVAGPGNNGGDAWVIARILADNNFKNILFYLLKISDRLSPDSEINRKRLIDQKKVKILEITGTDNFPELSKNDIIVDGIFGSGLTRPVEGLAADFIHHINKSGAKVISIDIPSGLFGEDNRRNNMENVVKASYTLTFQFPKLSFFFSENDEYVGEWHVLPIGLHPDIMNSIPSEMNYLSSREIAEKIKKRKKYSHKGTYGNALLIAGSYGMMGAAVLSAKACLRAGVGLITAHVPRKGLEIIQTAFPESLISIDESDEFFTTIPDISKYSAIAVGPGISKNKETQQALLNLLKNCKVPLVLDADALNIMGENKDWLNFVPKNSILTPHPKEFDRISGTVGSSFERFERQNKISQQFGIYIVLKGAHTAIACPDGKCYFNMTGNPGMATGGSGDVLTGMILSFLAQGYSPEDAANIGVFLHGMSADLAVKEIGEYSLISSDIIDYLGKAFLNLIKPNENENS